MEHVLDAPGLTDEQILEDMYQAEGTEDSNIPADLDALDDVDDMEVTDEELVHGALDAVPEEKPQVDQAAILQLVADLQEQIKKLRETPKNQVASKPGDKVYERIGTFSGKAPRQQQDLAKILTAKMPEGEKFTEAQVFGFLNESFGDYQSLSESRQDVTYLFRYYRGLKSTGFVGRNFLRVK